MQHEIYLRQHGFKYSAFRPFNINKERIRKFKDTRNSRCINQDEINKACFKHDMAYEDFQDLQIGYYVIKHLILLKI